MCMVTGDLSSALFDIGAQRSDPLLPLSASTLLNISAQRSDLILDRRSVLDHPHQRSLIFGKYQCSALRPILQPALSAQGNFSNEVSRWRVTVHLDFFTLGDA